MATLNGFDATQVEPSCGFGPIPEGKYLATIVGSELKPTKSGTGHYLELTFQLAADGEYKGRRVWARLNLDNPNRQAVDIARADLSAICRAVGVMRPQDSCELHNLPLSIKVACKTRGDTGDIANEIKGYERRGAVPSAGRVGAGDPPSGRAPVAMPGKVPAAQGDNSTPPWQPQR